MPISPDITLLKIADVLQEGTVPLYTCRVAAGFPSPADAYLDQPIDLNKLVFQHPAATFLVRVSGDSMVDEGIRPGDLLVVDRSLRAIEGRIVIAVVDGDCTVKRLGRLPDGTRALLAGNPRYPPVRLQAAEVGEIEFWGVVTYVLHDTLK